MKALLLVLLAVSASADPYMDFLNGILQTVEPSVQGNVSMCIRQSDTGMLDTRKGIAMIENGLLNNNFTSVFAGMQLLQTALGDIRTAAAVCNYPTVVNDFDVLLNLLQSNPLVVFEKLLPYLPSVVTDLQAAINDFAAGEYGLSGQNIGSVLVILLTDVGLSARKTAKAQKLRDGYLDFLNGILSTLEPAVAGNVTPCIQQSDTGFLDTRKGLYLIQQGILSDNMTEIFAGANYLSTALGDIRAAAAACNYPTVVADMDNLINMLATDPLSVLTHLLPYAPTVVMDLSNAVNYFNQGDYSDAGENIGSVLAILLTDTAAAKGTVKGSHFLVKGANGQLEHHRRHGKKQHHGKHHEKDHDDEKEKHHGKHPKQQRQEEEEQGRRPGKHHEERKEKAEHHGKHHGKAHRMGANERVGFERKGSPNRKNH